MLIKRRMKHLSGLLLASTIVFAALPVSAKAAQSPAYSPAKLSGIKEIAAKPGFWGGSVFALGKDGAVWSWGSNYSGQFANGTAGPANWSNAPHRVAGLEGTKKLVLGDGCYMALGMDGSVKAWGAVLRTGEWSAGDGNQWAIPLPETIDGLTGITDIAAGENSLLALRKDGSVTAWLAPAASSTGGISSDDAASSQEASHDESAMLPAASMVPGLTGVKAVYGDGGNLFSAVKRDGTLWLVTKETIASGRTPVKVSGPENVQSVVIGERGILALTKGGTVWASLSSGDAALNRLKKVPGLSGIVSI